MEMHYLVEKLCLLLDVIQDIQLLKEYVLNVLMELLHVQMLIQFLLVLMVFMKKQILELNHVLLVLLELKLVLMLILILNVKKDFQKLDLPLLVLNVQLLELLNVLLLLIKLLHVSLDINIFLQVHHVLNVQKMHQIVHQKYMLPNVLLDLLLMLVNVFNVYLELTLVMLLLNNNVKLDMLKILQLYFVLLVLVQHQLVIKHAQLLDIILLVQEIVNHVLLVVLEL